MSFVKLNPIQITDNIASAFEINEKTSGVSYISIDTVDSSGVINFGNTTTNPDYNFLGSGSFNVPNLTVSGSSTTDISIPNNNDNAYLIRIGGANFFRVSSLTDSQQLRFGNTTYNPDFNFRGSGDFNIDSLTASRLIFTDADKNFVSDTSGVTSANLTSMFDHITQNGTDHTYINQDLRTSASPSFSSETLSNNLIFSSNGAIRRNTSDGSDDGYLDISGGGSVGSARAAFIRMYGNENANTGILSLNAGNVSGGEITFNTQATTRMTIDYDGNISMTGELDTNFLHVLRSGTAVTPISTSSAVFQRSSTTTTACLVQIVSGNASHSQISFGDTDDSDEGAIKFSNDTNSFSFVIGGVEEVSVDSSGIYTIGDLTIENTNPLINFNDTDGKNFRIYSNASSLNFRDITAGSTRLEIDTSGNANFNGNVVSTGNLTGSDVYISVSASGTAPKALSITNDLTATAGTTMHQIYVNGGLITEDDSVTYSGIYGAQLVAPDITKGASDTITKAATLYISSAPTEGTNNYAILADSGHVSFDNGTFFLDSATNRVGIGTDSPERLLHVYAGNSGASSLSATGIFLENNGETAISVLTPNANASHLYMGTVTEPAFFEIDVDYNNSNVDIKLNTTGDLTLDVSSVSTITIGDGKLDFKIAYDYSDAFLVRQGSNNYFAINSGFSDSISMGNATTNPDYNFLGSGHLDIAGSFNVDKEISTIQNTQTITSDNNTLLDVSDTSFLVVSTNITSSPTGRTVGLESGSRDGHRVVIAAADDLSAFEINSTVPSSASTAWSGALTVENGGSVELIWDDNQSKWYKID